MSQKEKLIARIKGKPKDFTVAELDKLMSECGCQKDQGGRGSGLRYVHLSGRILTFDGPHPGKELYRYQVKMVMEFLMELGYI